MSGSHPHPMKSRRKLPANHVYMLVSESAVKRKREINIFTVATDGRLSEMLTALAVSPHLWCFAAPVVSPHTNRSARESGARNAYLCPLFSQRTRHGEHCVVRTRVVTNTPCKYLVFGVHSKLMRSVAGGRGVAASFQTTDVHGVARQFRIELVTRSVCLSNQLAKVATKRENIGSEGSVEGIVL